jgi:hypothetical protein
MQIQSRRSWNQHKTALPPSNALQVKILVTTLQRRRRFEIKDFWKLIYILDKKRNNPLKITLRFEKFLLKKSFL